MRRLSLALWCLFPIIFVMACRSGPPPSDAANEGLAARRQGVTGQYNGIVVLEGSCSNFANESDQVVCVVNTGKDPVKIGGWLIRNEIGRTYYLPAGFTLEPGKQVRIHTGAGTNSATNLYWNYQFKPVFDHQDQITLVDDGDVDVSKLKTP